MALSVFLRCPTCDGQLNQVSAEELAAKISRIFNLHRLPVLAFVAAGAADAPCWWCPLCLNGGAS